MKTLTQKIRDIGAARRKSVEARAAALIAEEMTLQKICQGRRVKTVRVTQGEVDPKPLPRKRIRPRH
jgi:hypothetical protein